jgi:type II secretory pathway pseudopilin PulG
MGEILMKKMKSFTLIELLLYVTIVGVFVSALVSFALNSVSHAQKGYVQSYISYSHRFLAEKIGKEIRNATGINTGSSDFDVNLADNSSYQLSLARVGADDPIIFNVSSGVLYIRRGLDAPQALNGPQVMVTDLTFTNNSSVDLASRNITYTLTVSTDYQGPRQEYIRSESLRSSSEIRVDD